MKAFFPDAILPSCHLGDIIEYDTVSNKSWSVDLRTHAIARVVDKLLSEPWPPAEESGREVPALKRQDDCLVCSSFLPFHSLAPTDKLSRANEQLQDCFKWDFGNYTL
jgi:lipase ATG15